MSKLLKQLSRARGAANGHLVKLVPAVFLSACTSWAAPPKHLMVDKDVVVSFQSSQAASESCSDLHKEVRGKKNNNIRACAFRKSAEAEPVVIIPNPCEFDDVYASLLCHELAHINQMAQNLDVDHKGWGTPIQLTKTAKSLPEFEKSASKNSGKLVQVGYEEFVKSPKAPTPEAQSANYLSAELRLMDFRAVEFRAVEFRGAQNLLKDVKEIKLRGLSALDAAP